MDKKSWDPIWEKLFKSREWGKYPETHIVKFIAKNYYSSKDRSKVKILDLGCGPGAHLWFLSREGFDTYGIDCSGTAIQIANERLKKQNLFAKLYTGDIVNLPYKNKFFNAIIDSAAIQHNNIEEIKVILKEVYRILKNNGKLFCTMVAKDKSLKDQYGKVHFLKKDEIKKLFEKFRDIKIDFVRYTEDNGKIDHTAWLIELTK